MASLISSAVGFAAKTVVIFAASVAVIGGSMWLTGTVVMPLVFGVVVACGLGQALFSE